jgi:CheY-like chemotaxis protein
MDSKILVIDDDSIILFIHRTMIKNSGIADNVSYFLSAELALANILENKDTYRFLLLLDINMPNMNGWELLDILKNQPFKENIKVIMVTSSINESDITKANAYDQVCGYLTKPIKPSDLKALQEQKELAHFFKE